MSNSQEQTASQRRSQLARQIKTKLQTIQAMVEIDSKKTLNWAGVGDLGHVNDLLGEILSFIDK